MEGLRGVAESSGFHVADFGPKRVHESGDEIIDVIGESGFAGIVTAFSAISVFHLESDREQGLTGWLQ